MIPFNFLKIFLGPIYPYKNMDAYPPPPPPPSLPRTNLTMIWQKYISLVFVRIVGNKLHQTDDQN